MVVRTVNSVSLVSKETAGALCPNPDIVASRTIRPRIKANRTICPRIFPRIRSMADALEVVYELGNTRANRTPSRAAVSKQTPEPRTDRLDGKSPLQLPEDP